MRHITVIALSVVCAFGSWAKDTAKPNPFKATLRHVPAAALPGGAARLVQGAEGEETATPNIVKAPIGIRPTVAPALVAAIAKAVADTAPIAAGVAAAEQP